jgi:phosphoribosyl 1,2-cyclic phosphodiesterase
MLAQGRYPHYLKKRISGDEGHLSNNQALELFTRHKPEFMSHLLLAHLSRDNNRPELVQELFSRNAGNTYVTVASRYEETAVYRVQAGAMADPQVPFTGVATVQLSLF